MGRLLIRSAHHLSDKGENMKSKLFGCLLAVILVMATTAGAADLRATGRDLAAKYGPAVLRINVVIKVASMDGEREEREIPREINGTVIGEDGLTVVPLSEIDPASMIRRVREIKIETTVKDIKLLMPDGKEVAATVVSRDTDLDLAFLRPIKKPATKMTAIDLADNAKPQLLEEVLVIARFGKIANRRIGAMTGEIQGIVEKPRTFYIPSSELATGGYGVPIFNAEGKVTGIVIMRTLLGSEEQPMATIMPASEILEIAKQVPEKAVETPKPAASPMAKNGENKDTEKPAGEKPADEKPVSAKPAAKATE